MKPTDISAPDYFHKVVDCQWACPAHTPVPEYIRLIAEGRYSVIVISGCGIGDAYGVEFASTRLLVGVETGHQMADAGESGYRGNS